MTGYALAVFLIACGTAFGQEEPTPVFRASETELEREQRMQWWQDAKFGMFVHWGIYAAAEGEWNGQSFPQMRPGFEWLMCKGQPDGIDQVEYVEKLAPKMTLNHFEPSEWANLAAKAGMKYFVITAKHHDGFGMVDFPNTDYDIAGQSPYAADPMIPLSKAVREAGLKFGFYFSQSQDWSKPGGRPQWFKGMDGDWDQYVDEHAVPQLNHLLGGRYGKIDLLWFDSGKATKTRKGGLKIWEILSLQPDLLVNNRLKVDDLGDFDCPEQWIPPTTQVGKKWETCMTLNGGWGYNPTDNHWKSTDELIRNLCLVVGRGGNFLLNVGPRADGSWQPEVVERLEGMGAWMRVNGEAIYGTRATTLPVLRWGITTWKPVEEGCRLYCHILDWPHEGILSLPINNKIRNAYFLGESSSQPVCSEGKDSLVINLKRSEPLDSAVTVLVLELEGTQPEATPLVLQQEEKGRFQLFATETECYGGVRVHPKAPQLENWHGSHSEKRVAKWKIRVSQNKTRYRLIARYGFNAAEQPEGIAFAVKVADQEAIIPLSITGVEVDSHNQKHNQLLIGESQSPTTLHLPVGLQEIEIRAVGVPANFQRPKGRENKKLCYSPFPLLQELRLEPVE